MVDLDGDGDLDALTGDLAGSLRYLRNEGSPSAPAFAEVTDTGNPWSGIDLGADNSPELVDLDGDGDLDVAVGGSGASPRYFSNTGGALAPAFLELTGSANPLLFIGFSPCQAVRADLDADGDLDLLVGEGDGRVVFFRSLKAIFADGFESGENRPLIGHPSAAMNSLAG